ncbi:MAG: cytochrome c [Azonexus sp.]|nr:cytochrome c [Azonexus sp.]MCK6411667.1 cytochrome c [Azonexus sp.]
MFPLLRRTLLVCLPCLLLACGEVEDTRPGQPVKQRQQAFKAMLRAFEPMGTMLREQRYQADAFARGARQLQALRDAPWPHFGPDTQYPPSKSRNTVWEKPQEFAQAKADFVAAVDSFAATVAGGQREASEKAYQQVYATCQGCHKQFRER